MWGWTDWESVFKKLPSVKRRREMLICGKWRDSTGLLFLSLSHTHTHQIWVAFYEGVKVSACKRVCVRVWYRRTGKTERGEGRAKIKEINDVLWGGSQASLIPYVCIWPHFRKVADFVQKAICTIFLTFSGAETDGEHLNVCVCSSAL